MSKTEITEEQEIIAEVAGMISDEIGDRLCHGGGDFTPMAVNMECSDTQALITLEDGRKLRITVELIP
jgi:hypothetical protein